MIEFQKKRVEKAGIKIKRVISDSLWVAKSHYITCTWIQSPLTDSRCADRGRHDSGLCVRLSVRSNMATVVIPATFSYCSSLDFQGRPDVRDSAYRVFTTSLGGTHQKSVMRLTPVRSCPWGIFLGKHQLVFLGQMRENPPFSTMLMHADSTIVDAAQSERSGNHNACVILWAPCRVATMT